MKKSFEKLPFGTFITDLEITKKNQRYIDQFISHLENHVAESRIHKYKHALTRFAHLVEKDFDKLTDEEVHKAGGIINSSKFSVKSKQDIITEVKTAFKFWFGNNEYFPRVVKGLKAPKSKERLRLPKEMPTEKDVYTWIKACQNTRDKFIVALMGLDGALRPGEIRNLTWGDCKKDKHGNFFIVDTIKESGDKSTRAIRIIKSEPYFIKWNQEYPRPKTNNAHVFINYSDFQPLTQGSITAIFARLKRKLKIETIYPYLMRHILLTEMSKSKEVSVPILKKFAGHAQNTNTIYEYLHHGDEDIKDMQLLYNGVEKITPVKRVNIRPIKCPKCKQSNEHDAEFCHFCNMALTQKRMVELNSTLESNNKLMYEQVKAMVQEIMQQPS